MQILSTDFLPPCFACSRRPTVAAGTGGAGAGLGAGGCVVCSGQGVESRHHRGGCIPETGATRRKSACVFSHATRIFFAHVLLHYEQWRKSSMFALFCRFAQCAGVSSLFECVAIRWPRRSRSSSARRPRRSSSCLDHSQMSSALSARGGLLCCRKGTLGPMLVSSPAAYNPQLGLRGIRQADCRHHPLMLPCVFTSIAAGHSKMHPRCVNKCVPSLQDWLAATARECA